MEEKLNWERAFEDIKRTHNSAYKTIDEAITLEEHEKPIEALEKYKEGISVIDTALNVRISSPEHPDPTWTQACEMIHKLKRTRAEVLTRINCLKQKHECVAVVPHEKKEPKAEDEPQTYSELACALKNIELEVSGQTSTLIYVQEGVKMYFISPDGAVVSTLDSQTLTIFSIEGDVPNCFLQVGNWIYPLIPGVSPCYRTNYNGFIFPDVHSQIEGSAVGIIIPEEADKAVYELLTSILHGVVAQHAEAEPEVPLSEKISSGIVAGASLLAHGLILGAEGICNLLSSTTPKLIDNITPAAQEKPIPAAVSQSMKMTECATNKTAQVTGYVADRIVLATSKLGQYLAPHIQNQGTRLLKSGFNYTEEEASATVKNVLTVAAGAVEGFSTVYSGLETSAFILGQNLKDNTVKIVKHKYGSPAGDVAVDTLNTVGNVVVIGRNAHILTPKGVVKTTAKQTGKAVVNRNALEE